MNKEEEFKESLNEILSSKEFAFDEAHWNAASDYIASARKKKRRALYFIIPALLLITGGLALYFFNTPNIALPNKTLSENAATDSHNKNNYEDGLPNKEVSVENSAISDKTDKPLQPEQAKPETSQPAVTASEPTKTAPTKVPSVKSSSMPSLVKNSGGNSTTTVKQAVNVNPAKEPIVRVPVNTPPVNTSSSSNTKPSIAVVTQSTTAEETAILNINEDPASKATSNTIVIPESEKPIVKTESNDQKTILEEVKSPPPLPLAQNESTVASTPSIAAVLPSKVDSTATPATNTPTNEARFFLFAEGGLSYAYGYKNPGFRDGNGFNPTIGLFGSTALTNKLSVGLGIQYNQVSQMEYSTKISKVTTYRFTEESDVIAITPQKLYYATFPIKISYTLNKNNLFGLGYNIGYLINTSSKVETYHQGINNTTDYKVSRSLGYTEGIKTFDKQIALFYRRRMADNFWVNAEFFFGLTDIKDNVIFKSDVREKNSGIKLTLMYNFFRK